MVIGERSPVLLHQRAHQLLRLVAGDPREGQVVDRHDQRRIRDDPQLAVDLIGPFREHPHAVAGSRLRDVLLRLLRLLLAEPVRGDLFPHPAHDLLDVHVVVPGIERPHLSCVPHHDPVLAHAPLDDGTSVVGREPALSPEHLDACRQPLQIPFPWAGKCLVEVVDVEQHLALGRSEDPEVRQVRIAAELHVDPGSGCLREVGRHDQCGAAVERERRDEHPSVADRDELRHPAARLLLEQQDRVRTGRLRAATRRVPTSESARGQTCRARPAPRRSGARAAERVREASASLSRLSLRRCRSSWSQVAGPCDVLRSSRPVIRTSSSDLGDRPSRCRGHPNRTRTGRGAAVTFTRKRCREAGVRHMQILKRKEFIAIPLVLVILGVIFIGFAAAAVGLWAWLLVGAVALVVCGFLVLRVGESHRHPLDRDAPPVLRSVDDGSVHRVLVVADGVCTPDGLRAAIDEHAAGQPAEAFVVAPALGSRLDRWTGDQQGYDDAAQHLDGTLRALEQIGVPAQGRIGSRTRSKPPTTGCVSFRRTSSSWRSTPRTARGGSSRTRPPRQTNATTGRSR